MQSSLQKNIATVRQNVERVCQEVGRTPDSVTILAATKTVPAEVVAQLSPLGITIAAENRVQEFLQKEPLVQNLTWHFIGSLQTNKVKHVVGRVALIHSVDRMSLADEIQRQSEKKGIVTDVLIEVNADSEHSKSGVYPEQLKALYHYLKNLPNIRVRGLMPVLPIDAKEQLYAQMNGIFCQMHDQDPLMTELSMGMSGDYETAIRYGATIVRLGSCLFGQRT